MSTKSLTPIHPTSLAVSALNHPLELFQANLFAHAGSEGVSYLDLLSSLVRFKWRSPQRQGICFDSAKRRC